MTAHDKWASLCDCRHENGESVCALELGLDPFGPCRKHQGATERMDVTTMGDEQTRYMPYHPWPPRDGKKDAHQS